MDETARKIAEHYTQGGLRERIRSALEDMGLDPDNLDPGGETGPDEFHTMGRPATVALANLAAIADGEKVLDVGCGMGGPARVLAHQFGAEMTGVDLTQEFVDVGRELTDATGLSDKVDLRVANALDLPFDDDSFDVAWTQHVTMNIADKQTLYRELRRVVRDGGRFAFFDITAGPGVEQMIYPTPWADDITTSFLVPPDEMRTLLETAGWKPRVWNDLTDLALGLYGMVASGSPPPGLPTSILLPDFRDRVANLAEAGKSDALRVLQAVCDTA
jgi:SAM-dependent methyltransferase